MRAVTLNRRSLVKHYFIPLVACRRGGGHCIIGFKWSDRNKIAIHSMPKSKLHQTLYRYTTVPVVEMKGLTNAGSSPITIEYDWRLKKLPQTIQLFCEEGEISSVARSLRHNLAKTIGASDLSLLVPGKREVLDPSGVRKHKAVRPKRSGDLAKLTLPLAELDGSTSLETSATSAGDGYDFSAPMQPYINPIAELSCVPSERVTCVQRGVGFSEDTSANDLINLAAASISGEATT